MGGRGKKNKESKNIIYFYIYLYHYAIAPHAKPKFFTIKSLRLYREL